MKVRSKSHSSLIVRFSINQIRAGLERRMEYKSRQLGLISLHKNRGASHKEIKHASTTLPY